MLHALLSLSLSLALCLFACLNTHALYNFMFAHSLRTHTQRCYAEQLTTSRGKNNSSGSSTSNHAPRARPPVELSSAQLAISWQHFSTLYETYISWSCCRCCYCFYSCCCCCCCCDFSWFYRRGFWCWKIVACLPACDIVVFAAAGDIKYFLWPL